MGKAAMGMRKPGRKRLPVETLKRRGTYQPVRHAERAGSGLGVAEDYSSWLEGLSPLAQREGRHFLEHSIPGSRDAFCVYLEHLADCERRYPLRNAPMDEKIRDFEIGRTLLEAVKWRRR
jgi:hypothetical protein